jgi:hypothetical protein
MSEVVKKIEPKIEEKKPLEPNEEHKITVNVGKPEVTVKWNVEPVVQKKPIEPMVQKKPVELQKRPIPRQYIEPKVEQKVEPVKKVEPHVHEFVPISTRHKKCYCGFVERS